MIRKRKVLLLVVCLMAVGLIVSLIGGCAGGGGGRDGSGEEETPQYGGVLNLAVAADPDCWDDALVVGTTAGASHATTSGPYQCLWSGDWAKGNAGGYGTKVCDWIIPGPLNRVDSKTGYIAESWEIGEDYITFHLRDEVVWQDVYPPNGREVTADDVVFSLERQKTLDTAYFKAAYPDTAVAMSISKVNESTVRIDCTSEEMPNLVSMIDFMYIYPKDVIETYGDMNDWERAIGSGPFTVKEYVPGSSISYEKSDNYWETYPVIGSPGDGDELPYLEGINVLIEPDAATRDALFTTGGLDTIACEYDRAQAIKASCPDAEYVKYFSGAGQAVIAMNLDKAPYNDVRVRQALMLAIDNQKIVDELFGGDGDVLYWPLTYCKAYAGAYLELDDYPDEPVLGPDSCTVDELFGYDPTKAKQLLADAGYPDGFKAEIVTLDYYVYTDQLTAVASYWADIGVELTIKPVDYNTLITTQYLHSYNDMLYARMAGAGTYFRGANWYGSTGLYNPSWIDDPVLNDYRDQMMAVVLTDEDEAFRLHREMLPYLQEQCYVIQISAFAMYRFWQPWVKNYSGEGSLGYYKFISNGWGNFCQYLWIDQELKAEMGYGD